MKTLSVLSLILSSTIGFALLSATPDIAKAETTTPKISASLSVAELFTSQSCSSCPPAEALFSDLAEREDLLTLEWHVDYWDTLIHGGSKWKDPYSDKAFTNRQRTYNQSLRGTRGVYTPQAIVNGKTETVGNSRGKVSSLLKSAEQLPLSVDVKNNVVSVGANEAEVEVLFVRLLKQHKTDVKGGENKGRRLHGKNIVLEAVILGNTSSTPTQFDIPSVKANESCAVLVQSLTDDLGPILGAARCH